MITDRAMGDARREAALEVLRQVRPDGLGGVKLNYVGSGKSGTHLTERSELVKAMRFAEQSYPTSWLTKANDRGRLSPS